MRSLPAGLLKPDASREPRRRVEELDLPGQLSGNPEAGTDPLMRREVAGRRIVEAIPSIDDLAHKAPLRASDTDFSDAASVSHRVVRDFGSREQEIK